jgi:hypothetical protein
MKMTHTDRNLVLEDAISPLVERAKIALGTFDARWRAFFSLREASTPQEHAERQEQYAALLNEGHPTPSEVRRALRGRGLGSITYDELRAVIMRMFLRDTPEDCGAYEQLAPMQQLARTVANWIMSAFEEAIWDAADNAACAAISQRYGYIDQAGE